MMNKNTCKEKQDLLMANLTDYFVNNKDNMQILLAVIREQTSLSLRVLDWFVTNYAKKHNVVYRVKDPEYEWSNPFNVYLSYKAQLKAYSKKHFDPFRRRNRITFYYEPKKFISTTVGQLNFFRWAINNGVLTYVRENMEQIESDMIKTMQHHNNITTTTLSEPGATNTTNTTPRRKKKQNMSISATKTITKEHVKVRVSFD